jgi:EpsD family peptidyl-prolyl cis-trans isomerase
MNRKHPLISSLLLVVLTFTLGACSEKEGGAKSGTQVVARVNGEELSIHQLNFQMSQLAQVSEDQAKAASRQVLERLVDRQLLLQRSVEAKLDRDPGVLQALDNSKREILAQAYMEQQMAKAGKPSVQEMNDFYTKHPELFEKRRIYRLQELAVMEGNDKLAEIEAGMKAVSNINGIANWLKQKDYKFSINVNMRAAEQLPLELLAKLYRMKDGEIIVIPNQNSINIVVMAGSQEQPLTLEKATPLIEQYFLSQRKSEIAKQQMAALRKEAKIEFLGDFADMNPASGKEPVKMLPVESKPQAMQENPDSAHIEKGVSGL